MPVVGAPDGKSVFLKMPRMPEIKKGLGFFHAGLPHEFWGFGRPKRGRKGEIEWEKLIEIGL